MNNSIKISSTITELQKFNEVDKKTASMGLKIEFGDSREFYKTTEELIDAVKKLKTEKLYKIEVETSLYSFKTATVKVSYLTKEEINKPFKVVRIARNINAFDNEFSKITDVKKFNFWNDLNKKLNDLLKTASPRELKMIKKLTKTEQQKFFNLCN